VSVFCSVRCCLFVAAVVVPTPSAFLSVFFQCRRSTTAYQPLRAWQSVAWRGGVWSSQLFIFSVYFVIISSCRRVVWRGFLWGVPCFLPVLIPLFRPVLLLPRRPVFPRCRCLRRGFVSWLVTRSRSVRLGGVCVALSVVVVGFADPVAASTFAAAFSGWCGVALAVRRFGAALWGVSVPVAAPPRARSLSLPVPPLPASAAWVSG